MASILIAGGSGLIGKRLTELLLAEGHRVSWLSHSRAAAPGVTTYTWNPSTGEVDPAAFTSAEAVIVLSGSGVAARRWTTAYKREIIQSRLDAASTLLRALRTVPHQVHTIVAASAVGIYGDRGDELLTEASATGTGFLAETTRQWEAAYADAPVRTVHLRIGIVLSTHGGALPQMAAPLRMGICPVLGNGRQYMSWIQLDDLCSLFLYAVQQPGLRGPLNAAGTAPVTHRDFMLALRKTIAPRALVVPVPALVLQTLMGEQSHIVLDSTRVSADGITAAGFRFRYPDIFSALKQCYEK